jgi:HK97 family phage prohead protease
MTTSAFSFGEAERRSFALDNSRARFSRCGPDERLVVKGHASVFESPSCELSSPAGNFRETIARGAFTKVLARAPQVYLTYNHSMNHVLASTSSGGLELTQDARGLRFFGRCSDTSYARDLQELMSDGVVSQASFMFRVAPQGESWRVDNRTGTVWRTIHEVQDLYDVCLAASGAYSATDSSIARTAAISYAVSRGFISRDPAFTAALARKRAELDLQRRRLSA